MGDGVGAAKGTQRDVGVAAGPELLGDPFRGRPGRVAGQLPTLRWLGVTGDCGAGRRSAAAPVLAAPITGGLAVCRSASKTTGPERPARATRRPVPVIAAALAGLGYAIRSRISPTSVSGVCGCRNANLATVSPCHAEGGMKASW